MLPSSKPPDHGNKDHSTMEPLPTKDDAFSSSSQLPPERSNTPVTNVSLGSASIHTVSGQYNPRNAVLSEQPAPKSRTDETRHAILQSFLPRVFVLASADTEELVRLKGVYGGLAGLLRPFGESILGNIVARDSTGASKNLAPFGIHFLSFSGGVRLASAQTESSSTKPASTIGIYDVGVSQEATAKTFGSDEDGSQFVDEILYSYLRGSKISDLEDYDQGQDPTATQGNALSYYTLYLRKLLAGRSLVPHETFTHPVACLIAISSQSAAPIEILRDLYDETRYGSKRIPGWLGSEFLRYYLLIHDEDHDDITKTTALFDQMKKHFGLHCHLLRIRSVECSPENQDRVCLPPCNWLSALEEVEHITRRGRHAFVFWCSWLHTYSFADQNLGIDEFRQFIFDTDVASIRGFIREMVTQSIIPFMEGRVTAWNDQVASRRRGISGRFMSLSKRWNAFGSGRSSKAAPTSSSGSNFDARSGVYLPDSLEAVMQRLAGYSFMLHDWRLSSSVYDMLRSDFTDDKAWRHSALANEMTAFSILLGSRRGDSPLNTNAVDQMLDAASYSYLARCSDPAGATRCLVLAVELYKAHGDAGLREATKWADRLLELSILSPLCQSLVSERLAQLFQSRNGSSSLWWGLQHRKAAFWNLITADSWLLLGKPVNARVCLSRAKSLHATSEKNSTTPPFPAMFTLMGRLQQRASPGGIDTGYGAMPTVTNGSVDEEHEDFHDHSNAVKSTYRLSTSLQPSRLEPMSLYQKIHETSGGADDGFI